MSESEVAEVKKHELAAMPEGAWGAADESTPDDFFISKALLMQSLSDQVVNGEAKIGEYRDSASGELLAEEGEDFEVLVFHRDMTWVVFEDKKYKETLPLTDENRDLPIEDGKIERNKTFNFYMLPVKQLAERPEATVPVVISLKRTGLRTAKGLQMFFHKLKAENKPSAAKVVRLNAEKRTNDMGTFFVAAFKEGRDATEQELASAFNWYKDVKQAFQRGIARVDNSDEVAQGKGKSRDAGTSLDDSEVPF